MKLRTRRYESLFVGGSDARQAQLIGLVLGLVILIAILLPA